MLAAAERLEKLEAIVTEHAKARLNTLMSEISENHYCAGWMGGMEFDLWSMVLGGSRYYGMGDVDAETVAELKRISEDAGGWWAGDEFVHAAEWAKEYAVEAAKRKLEEERRQHRLTWQQWRVKTDTFNRKPMIVTESGEGVEGGGLFSKATVEELQVKCDEHNAVLASSQRLEERREG